MNEIVIPKLGMTMKEGTIVEWSVPDGTTVATGDLVFVLSTDKLDTEVYAEASGTVHHRAEAGETHPVGTVVGVILGDGEVLEVGGSGNGSAPPTPQSFGQRVIASPLARRVADRVGVDLATLRGTGPGGRIVKADVEAAAAAAPTASADRPHDGAWPAETKTIPLRGMRKVIADRMHASLQGMAQLTLGMEVDVTDAAALRRQLNEQCEPDGVRLSFTDLVCKAATRALADHPGLNASVEDDVIRLHPEVHLGLAVAVPDGLLVPVVRGAARLSLRELSVACARLAAACRDGAIGVDGLEGSTFTVTTLGSSGIDFFTPVVNPPNVAILGVGRVHDGVGWDGDRPVRRQLLTLSLTIDHRAVDGAPGAAFLASVRELLESPYRLLI